MGILWASNSHPPQRDLAHGCGRSHPGLNKTARLRFRLPAFQARDAPAYPLSPSPPPPPTSSAGNLAAEPPVARLAAARWEDGGKLGRARCGRDALFPGERHPGRCHGFKKKFPISLGAFGSFPLTGSRERAPASWEPGQAGQKDKDKESWRFPGAGYLPAPSLSAPAAGRQTLPSFSSCLLSLADNCHPCTEAAVLGTGKAAAAAPAHLHPLFHLPEGPQGWSPPPPQPRGWKPPV